MKPLYEALDKQRQGGFSSDSLGLAPLVWSEIKPRDVILCKGSRAARMERVVEFLSERSRE